MTISPEQMRKKTDARAESEMHAQRNVLGKEYSFYDAEGQQQNEYNEPAPVSKERLEKEYDKMPGGDYTHKKAGTY